VRESFQALFNRVRTFGPDVSSLFRRSVPSAPPSIRIANLQKLNQIDCTFLAGLAKLRLSQIDEAEVALKGVLSLDVNLAGHEEWHILGSAGLLPVAGALAALPKSK